ncbi:MAG: PDZ domain-containing protein [Chthonomonas sp.]|nr:PDZ domain-containing protein [Chthonomonas sp.]
MMLPLLAGIILGQAAPATKPVNVVPFKRGENSMIIDATVNGVKGSFMFDTGFAGAFVMGDQYNIGPATGTITLRDFVGELQAKTVKMRSLEIGGMKIKCDDDIVQQPGENMSESYGVHCDGIMGLSVFKDQIFEINFQKNEIYFYPKTYDITKKPTDNKKTFLQKMLPMGNTAIELLVHTKDEQEFILTLDTGNAFYATTYLETIENAGLWPKEKKPDFMKSSFVASGEVPSFTTRLADLHIFGVPVKESYWDIIAQPSGSADSQGTVGFGFLSNFNVTIDLGRRRVFMEMFKENAQNEAEAELGLVALYDEELKGVVVYRVMPKSPADKAGIKPLDHILSLDGVELQKQGYREMRRLLEGAPGSKVKVIASRQGVVKRYEIERDYLINQMPPRTAGSPGQASPPSGGR